MAIYFPDFSPTIGFVAFSRTVGNLWRNPCISHMLKYTIRWESTEKKSSHTTGKVWVSIFQTFPITWFFFAFSHTMRNLWENPCISLTLKYTIGWKLKSTHTMGKVWVSVSQNFPIPWVLLHFPVLWEIYGETHAFPIWWHRLIFSCVAQNYFL